MRRWIVALLLVSSTLVPGFVGASATKPIPVCSASRLTFALGPTQRYSAARPFRGGLTSITWIRITNGGGTCRFPVSPSVSFDFSQYNSASSLFSAIVPAGAAGATEVLAAGGRANLVAYVRVVPLSRYGFCEPRTALAIAVILSQRERLARYLFPRRIGTVCSNQDPAASNFGVVWQNWWVP
jgi:hypothetical protein